MGQRYFAARSEREAGLLFLCWIVLPAFRWPFIMAIAIIGVVLTAESGALQYPETGLPIVIDE